LAVLAAALVLSISTPVVRADVLSLDDEKTAELSGYVYVDVNNNGEWDEPEHGLFDVTITLDKVDDEGNLITRTTTTTDLYGCYRFYFEDLMPGDNHTYTITETTPLEYLEGKSNPVGTFGGIPRGDVVDDNPNQFVKIKLTAGDRSDGNYNFCEWGLKAGYISKRPYLIIPEPSVSVLLAMALPGLFGMARYRRRRRA
jgi:hypothetical protein